MNYISIKLLFRRKSFAVIGREENRITHDESQPRHRTCPLEASRTQCAQHGRLHAHTDLCPPNTPQKREDPASGKPEVFRSAAGPLPPQRLAIGHHDRGAAQRTARNLFCLLPGAVPKQRELNIYKAVTVCLMFSPHLRSLMGKHRGDG